MRPPLIALALLAASCGEGARGAEGPDALGFVPAPSSHDRGEACADVGSSVRACYGRGAEGAGCERGVCVSERPLPAMVAPPLGFVCVGRGEERRCRDRRARTLPFSCGDSGCVQGHPTLPDDGEWECMDAAGAALCRAISGPAGVSPVSSDDRAPWHCGPRGGHEAELVCVDLSPDVPDGDALAWRCEYDLRRGIRRTCAREEGPRLGAACDGDGACPEGALCVARRCVPPSLSPSCWLDADCGAGRACRFGSCVEGAR